jgi:hypothetical protein
MNRGVRCDSISWTLTYAADSMTLKPIDPETNIIQEMFEL